MAEPAPFRDAEDGRSRHPVGCIDSAAAEEIAARREAGEYLWVNLHAADDAEIASAGEALGLHPLTIEDMQEFDQRAKVEDYENYAYIVAYGATVAELDEDSLVEIHIVYSPDFLMTVAREESIELGALHDQATQRPLSGHELLHSVLDVLIDSYAPVLDRIDGEVEQLETLIVNRDLKGRDLEIHDLRRTVGKIDRVIHRELEAFTRIREILRRMPDHHAEDFPYFRDLQDHLAHTAESIDTLRERIAALFELYLAGQNNRQNVVMKQFTVIAGIFLPLSVITGFFGMNFAWMVQTVDTKPAFFALGIGFPLLVLCGLLWVIASRGLFRE